MASILRRVVSFALVITGLILVSSALAGSSRGCTGSVHVSEGSIALHASALRPRHLSCSSARILVRKFLSKKLHDQATCAALASNPPFAGCRVEHYLCRATAAASRSDGVAPELCTRGERQVRFREKDLDNG